MKLVFHVLFVLIFVHHGLTHVYANATLSESVVEMGQQLSISINGLSANTTTVDVFAIRTEHAQVQE